MTRSLLLPALCLLGCPGHPPRVEEPQSLVQPEPGVRLEPVAVDAQPIQGPMAIEPGQEQCPANAAPLPSGCFSLIGTRWQFTNRAPGRTRVLVIRFLHQGVLDAVEPNDPAYTQTLGVCSWAQEGSWVRFSIAAGYSTYTTMLSSTTEMAGAATNLGRQQWEWSAVRLADQ